MLHCSSHRCVPVIAARVDPYLALSPDIPDQAGGWIHEYVCPDHAAPLIYDPQSPDRHRCPHGEDQTGAALDAAWRVLRHREYADAARDAAALYAATGEMRYACFAAGVLSIYADCYNGFDGAAAAAQPWMTKGKAFQQALTEAIWLTSLADTLRLCRSTLDEARVARIHGDLFAPAIQTLAAAQAELIRDDKLKSNYMAWLLCAHGLVAIATGDHGLLGRMVEDFAAHLTAGILPDNFEYEASPYYHNFVALAYSLLAEAALTVGVDLYSVRGARGQSIAGMWAALASLANPDGTMPKINDGAYWRGSIFDSELCDVYEIAYARTGNPEYAWIAQKAYARRGVTSDRFAALVYGAETLPNPPNIQLPEAVLLPAAGIAVHRRDPLAVTVQFGPYAGAHRHADALAPSIFPFSTDPGLPPYASPLRHPWYMSAGAHNTVLIDGQSLPHYAGELVVWTENACTLRAKPIPGLNLQRAFELEANAFTDTVNLQASQEHTYDWLLHADAPWQPDGVVVPATSRTLWEGPPGQYIRLTGAVPGVRRLVARLTNGPMSVAVEMDRVGDMFFAECPGVDGLQPRYLWIARLVATSATIMYRVSFDA